MWNTSKVGSTISNITFRDCWFEPQPRMVIEMNGRGGWWHDVTIDHCTFEAGGGQMLSFDMSPVDSDPVAPWGINVGGVVRGVEGLHITDNDFRGTGVTVNGFAPRYTMGLEFGCVYPYAKDASIGRSRVHRQPGRALRLGLVPVQPQRRPGHDLRRQPLRLGLQPRAASPSRLRRLGRHLHQRLQRSRTTPTSWARATACRGASRPPCAGSGNTFAGEHWTKPAGKMADCVLPFTNSTYTDCHFHLPVPVRFPASASGTGYVFDNGHTGGTFD